jgi:diguanylate cyclase (GGDEF)-like protein
VLNVVAERDRELVAENLRRRVAGELNTLSYEFRMQRKDGTEIDVEVHGNRTMYEGKSAVIGMLLDVSERKHIEARLEYQATHDVLTGLPNRNLLSDRLGQAIHLAERYQRQVAAVFVDLDNFKHINDTLGHQQGDQILRSMVERLENTLRGSDTLARVGGDEFGIVLSSIEEEETLPAVIQRIMAEIQRPFFLEGREYVITGSIGATVYPKDGNDAETLIRNADAAMHQAKESGNNLFRFYSAEINARVKERISLEGKLRHAVENGELALYYQPQVDLRLGRVTGAEALLRWKHPDLGMVSPARFIPLAEETGLIVPIGEWVLREACRQTAAWQQDGVGDLCVAVNLSARQFHEQDIPAVARQALLDSGLEAHLLELEVTESMVMRNVNDAVATLFELKDTGMSLAMDDFGTGYSSLSYLKRFAIDKLKIDQSFVRDLATDPNDAAIANAIIALAHSLNLEVIAEGVETAEQLAFLQQNGCDAIQGYYFSKPLPAEEFATFLQSGVWLESLGKASIRAL